MIYTNKQKYDNDNQCQNGGAILKKLKKQYLFILVLSCLLSFTFFKGLSFGERVFEGGTGTKEDPYKIKTQEQLDNVRNYLDKNFVLVDDIYINKEIDPIGSKDTPFSGTFEGRDHTILGLKINKKSENKVGLFSVALGGKNQVATIKNLNIKNAEVIGNNDVAILLGEGIDNVEIENIHIGNSNVKGMDSVSGLIGRATKNVSLKSNSVEVEIKGEEGLGAMAGFLGESCSIKDCSAKSRVEGIGHIGGFAGRVYGTIENSYSNSDVKAVGEDHDASIFAGTLFNSGKIEKCKAVGKAVGYTNVAGLVGRTLNYYPENITPPTVKPSPTIKDSFVEADLSGVSIVGGVVGYAKENTIVENCYAKVNINFIDSKKEDKNIQPKNHAGGIIGKADFKVIVKESSSIGKIEGDEGLGGIVGYLGKMSTIENSSTAVQILGNGHIGGVVGRCYGEVNEVKSYSDVTLLGDDHDAAGIAGTLFNSGKIENCEAYGNIKGNENVGGIVARTLNYYADPSQAPEKEETQIIRNCRFFGTVEGKQNVNEIVGKPQKNAITSNNHYLGK